MSMIYDEFLLTTCQNTESAVSKSYVNALRHVLNKGVSHTENEARFQLNIHH
jgi:hypothetical protein